MNELYLLLFVLFLQFLTVGYVYWKSKSVEVPVVQETIIPYPDNHLTPFDPSKEVFVTFPCGNCTEQIVVEEHLMPGDIHVIDCENCKTSWSIYNPSLVIKQTKDLPDSLKTAVAQNMAELHA